MASTVFSIDAIKATLPTHSQSLLVNPGVHLCAYTFKLLQFKRMHHQSSLTNKPYCVIPNVIYVILFIIYFQFGRRN